MGKKKDNAQFNNPFSALKGLSVSADKKPEKKPEPKPVSQPEPKLPQIEADADFFSEMSGLGVRKIDRDSLEKPDPVRLSAETEAEASFYGKKERVQTGGRVARPRRDKLLRRGDLEPQAELDLHGVKTDAVQQKVGWFLENSKFYGFEAVRIITGKGNHSDTGPVLRPLVEAYLNGPGRTYVIEWVQAPPKQGGAGAIIVFLKVD